MFFMEKMDNRQTAKHKRKAFFSDTFYGNPACPFPYPPVFEIGLYWMLIVQVDDIGKC